MYGREQKFMSPYGLLTYTAIFLFGPRWGLALYRKEPNCMENQALEEACKTLESILIELGESMDDTQESYFHLFSHTRTSQKNLQKLLQQLRNTQKQASHAEKT